MADRGAFVSVAAWAISLLLLSVSLCTCTTVTFPPESDVLSKEERMAVYRALEEYLGNAKGYIIPDREYHNGRLFTQYIDLKGKGAVIRFTRWTEECSVSLSATQYTSKGSDLMEAWKPLLQRMRPFLMEGDKGYEWVAVSKHTDWIDYYVIKDFPPPLGEDQSFKTVSEKDAGRSKTDCAIHPSMLLSHYSALPFSRLSPGDSLISPDGKYKLTIPQSGRVMAPCVLNLEDAATGGILWQSDSHAPVPQNTCVLAFRSDGRLELWNDNKPIWETNQACSNLADCAGAASLAFSDGHIKLYRSVGNYLGVYWST